MVPMRMRGGKLVVGERTNLATFWEKDGEFRLALKNHLIRNRKGTINTYQSR